MKKQYNKKEVKDEEIYDIGFNNSDDPIVYRS